MQKVSVRDLRYRFSAIEDALRQGEEIQITRHKRVVARLLPPEPPAMPEMPDFLGRMKKIFKGKVLKTTGAKLVSEGRGRY